MELPGEIAQRGMVARVRGQGQLKQDAVMKPAAFYRSQMRP